MTSFQSTEETPTETGRIPFARFVKNNHLGLCREFRIQTGVSK